MTLTNLTNIEWIVFAVIQIVLFIIGFLFGRYGKMFKGKPKRDLHNLKRLTYDAGIANRESYVKIKELEKVFDEIENGQ